MPENRNLVRALGRGLEVLKVLNQFNGQNIMSIQSKTSYSRSSLYRILETFIHEGYVALNPADKLYRLTSKSRGLSVGYKSDHWLAEIVKPVFEAYTNNIPWPVTLSVLRGDKLVVECMSTYPSKITVRRFSAGWELRLFQSASGVVTAGSMEQKKVEALICEYASTQPDSTAAENELKLRIQDAQDNGYSIIQQDRNRTIAVPINFAPHAIGALAIFGENSTKWTAKDNSNIVSTLADLATKIEMQLH